MGHFLDLAAVGKVDRPFCRLGVTTWYRRLEHTWNAVDDGKGKGVMLKSAGLEILAVGLFRSAERHRRPEKGKHEVVPTRTFTRAHPALIASFTSRT